MSFILEISVLQIAAINRTNKSILKKFQKNAVPNTQSIVETYNEFNENLSLWDINNFNYQLARNLFIEVQNVFEIDKIKAEYLHNNKIMEKIITIRQAKQSEKENSIKEKFFLIFTLIGILSTLDSLIWKLQPIIFSKISDDVLNIITVLIWVLFIIIFLGIIIFIKIKKLRDKKAK